VKQCAGYDGAWHGVILAFLTALFMLAGCSSVPEHYIALHDASRPSIDELLEMLSDSGIIFAGEIHDDPESQGFQDKLIRFLVSRGLKKVVIATELFSKSEQSVLDNWIEVRIDPLLFPMIFSQYVNLPYDAYSAIFEFARGHGIRIVGINADSQQVALVARRGIDAIPEELKKKYHLLACSEDTAYSRVIGFPIGAITHSSQMDHLCDGQRFRDAVMAFNIGEIVNSYNATVIVLTGAVHAVRPALPSLLKAYTQTESSVILPAKIRALFRRNLSHDMADYVWY